METAQRLKIRVLDFRSIHLCAWEVKGIFVLVLILSNLQSTQDTGSGTTVPLWIISYWPFAHCWFWHRCPNIAVFFLSRVTQPLTAGRWVSPCRCCQEIICVALSFFTLASKNTILRSSTPNRAGIQMDLARFPSLSKMFLSLCGIFFSEGWECLFFSGSLLEGFTVMGRHED